jgi:hypothetical protein
MRGRPTSRLGRGLAARSSRGGGPRRGNGRAPGVPMAWSPCAVIVRYGAVARSPVAQWRLASSKVLLEISRGPHGGAGAHQSGGPTVRRRKRRRAVMFNGGGVASVVVNECGGVL